MSDTVPSSPAASLQALHARLKKTLDDERQSQLQKRHARGARSARENLADLCDPDTFLEYGQLAVAAQRQRTPYEQLQTQSPADGVITGIGRVNSDTADAQHSRVAIAINDYSVMAGTQGYYHHLKLDRLLKVAEKQSLPVIMYTEGGGGRPGDTDVTTVNSGLQCTTFATWAALAGKVPRIAVNHGYCFAGNASLFGCADITIATQASSIGMAGPAMIEGGGLGSFAAEDIGPADMQAANGVIDILCEDEGEATRQAKRCLRYFQGSMPEPRSHDQRQLRELLPDDRRFAYEVRKIIDCLADNDSVTELGNRYGAAIITAFIRIDGHPMGLLASDCKVLGGAIDVHAAEKAARFIKLCDQFELPIVSLCDTPGFMVGPEHEKLGAVRRLSPLFTNGAQRRVPLIAVVLRKCYGLGAQALLGGSTQHPDCTLSWPSGEFGPMGLEGAVKLGYRKELNALEDSNARQALYEKLLKTHYQRGQAMEVASVLEIDAVIDPADTRQCVLQALNLVTE